jgi:hypothetical protein
MDSHFWRQEGYLSGNKEQRTMSGENASDRVKPSIDAFEQQTEYKAEGKTYTARCAICGRDKTEKKPWYRSHDETRDKLRLKFFFCETCGKWVCEDCFYIDDGKGNGIGICTTCAKERGRTGLTLAQFEEAWPELQKRIWARGTAARRAMRKEE